MDSEKGYDETMNLQVVRLVLQLPRLIVSDIQNCLGERELC